MENPLGKVSPVTLDARWVEHPTLGPAVVWRVLNPNNTGNNGQPGPWQCEVHRFRQCAHTEAVKLEETANQQTRELNRADQHNKLNQGPARYYGGHEEG